jgi:hypothetical protein
VHALGRCTAIVVIALVLAQAGLRTAAHFRPARSSAWDASASQRILCVGDSHTWGGGIALDEAYPAQLQRILDGKAPGFYSVINMGIPGMNTTQLHHRLPVWLSRYELDIVIAWAGVNNAWSTAEREDEPKSALAWLDRLLIRSRVYKLAHVRIHDRNLERYAVESASDRIFDIVDVDKSLNGTTTRVLEHGGIRETITHRRGQRLDEASLEEMTFRDYAGIVKYVYGKPRLRGAYSDR